MVQNQDQEWWSCDGDQGSAQDRFVVGLLKLSKIITTRSEPILHRYNVTFLEFEILISLRNSYPQSLRPTEIYRSQLVSSGGTTKGLKNLKKKEFVEVIPDKHDKRSKKIALTEKGKTTIERIKEEVISMDESLLAPSLTQQDMLEIAKKLNSVIDQVS